MICILDLGTSKITSILVKDEDKTITQLLTEKTGEIGEKISVRRFARFELGEGIEKQSKSFAQEVEEQIS